MFLQAGAEAGSSLTAQTTYQYDLVMLTLQVMSNYGLELHNTSWLAYNVSVSTFYMMVTKGDCSIP